MPHSVCFDLDEVCRAAPKTSRYKFTLPVAELPEAEGPERSGYLTQERRFTEITFS